MADQQAEPIQVFPPSWFVENFNAGVARDWAGEGVPPYRGTFDPLVMFSWYLATHDLRRTLPMARLTGIA